MEARTQEIGENEYPVQCNRDPASDASLAAYGAVTYLRLQHRMGTVVVYLLMAKIDGCLLIS